MSYLVSEFQCCLGYLSQRGDITHTWWICMLAPSQLIRGRENEGCLPVGLDWFYLR